MRWIVSLLVVVGLSACSNSEDPVTTSTIKTIEPGSEETTTTVQPVDPTTTTVPSTKPPRPPVTEATTTTVFEPATTLAVPRPTTPLAPSGVVRGEVGETITVAGIEVTVEEVFFDTCAGDPFSQVAPGLTGLFIRVRVTNVSYVDTARYGIFEWDLLDYAPDHEPMVIDAMLGHCHQPDENPPLGQGVTATAVLGFEVLPELADLGLRYAPLGRWDDVQTGEIDLGI